MVLSKPIYDFLGFYFENLFTHPVKTKAISSFVVATAGNLASQYVAGNKVIDHQNLFAYSLFGLLFGGTLPHYFYSFLERVAPEEAAFAVVKRIILERLVYAPLYQAFSLYVLARFEGKDHKTAVKQVEALYWPVLKASWKYLTIIQIVNLSFVPPMLRVLTANLIGFFWIIFLANRRREAAKKASSSK